MASQLRDTKFKVEDIVFSKLKGYASWPSIIREIACTKLKVEFFCPEKTWAWIHTNNVQLFTNEMVNIMRKKNANNRKLQQSINEALVYIEETKKKSQNHIHKISKAELSRLRKFEEPQATAERNIDEEVSSERSKKEMNENEKMRKLREYFEAMKSSEPTIDRIIDLKDIKPEDIIKTFPKYEAVLREMFQKNRRIPDCRFLPELTENQFLTILDELLNENQQKDMYLKIRSELDRKTVDHITSNHENLFWKGILPEWALQIFMDKFKLDRANAIKQLNNQASVKDAQKYPLDLSF